MLVTLWLVAAAQAPTAPPLVQSDAPRAGLTAGERSELMARRAELLAQMPPTSGPIAATVGSGVLVVGGAFTLVGSFFASFFSKPCTGFFCISLGFDAGRATAGYVAGALFLAAGVATLPFALRMLKRTLAERSALDGQVDQLDERLGTAQ